MCQRSIPEWRCEGGCDGNEEERYEDLAIGDYGCGGFASSVVAEVQVAGQGCEEGLYGIEEDWEFELFGRG